MVINRGASSLHTFNVYMHNVNSKRIKRCLITALIMICVNLRGIIQQNGFGNNQGHKFYLQQSGVPWPGYDKVRVFSPPKHNATVAICLIVRNETRYMVR